MAEREQKPREPAAGDEAAGDQGGVFGNLPGTRPGVRSPRRAEQSGPARQPKSSVRRATRSPSSARPPAPSGTPEPETPPAGDAEHGGVEDLAWAGVAVAAEAATLGVRLLSRAVEAVRKPADRR
jgi:hypothetical protein